MTDPSRTIKLLKATGPDAFPALSISAAAPAELLDDDTVAALPGHDHPVLREMWAAELSAVIATHATSVRELGANEAGWTHHVRIEVEGDPGRPPRYRDFVVVATGLPDEDSAAANGYEFGALLVDVALVAGGRRGRAN